MLSQRRHYENFPVASVLLPARMRPHVAALYAFARSADDFADEGSLTDGERLELLEGWRARLHSAASGRPSHDAPRKGEPPDAVVLFEQLATTIRDRRLPLEHFEQLLSAFRQDVSVHRYESWSGLLDYCSRSANPVGRLVLRIADYRDDQLDLWSDAVCTALQLTNFWQDLALDFRRGRVYVPMDDVRAHGADVRSLDSSRMDDAWCTVIAEMVRRTRRLFVEGRPVCDAVSGRLRLELRATWLGGMRILDRIEAGGFDALVRRPVIRPFDVPWFVGRLMMWPLTTSW